MLILENIMHWLEHLWVVRAGAKVLGSCQYRGVLLLWHIVGQGLAVLAAGAGWVGCFLVFSSRLSYLSFSIGPGSSGLGEIDGLQGASAQSCSLTALVYWLTA